MSSLSIPDDRASRLAALREQVRRLEGLGGTDGTAVVPLGLPQVDACLPGGGLPLGAVHEVVAPRPRLDTGAATAFAAWMAARLAGGRGPILWITQDRDLYPPGLAPYGLGPEALILVRAGSAADVLWSVEEALRCTALGAVLGEVSALDLATSRRLQLAAESGGVPGITLRLSGRGEDATAAVTRWRVRSSPLASLAVPEVAHLGPDIGFGGAGGLAGLALAEQEGGAGLARLGGALDGGILAGEILAGEILGGGVPGGGFAPWGTGAAWGAELVRCRGRGRPGAWRLLWLDGRLAVAPGAEGGTPAAQSGQAL